MCLLVPNAAKWPRNLTQRAQEAPIVGARVMEEYRACPIRESAHGRTCEKLGRKQ